jgi:hypothetical protein
VGESNWYAAPAEVVSTKNVEPIRTSGGSGVALTGSEVIAAATGASLTPASTTPAPAPAVQPVKTRPTQKKASN